MMISGFAGSSSVSILVELTVSQSTIALGSVYRLQLLPLFNRLGHYTCDISLSIPTCGGFYTCKFSLKCSPIAEDAEIVLGFDWISSCSVTVSDDRAELEDPTASAIASLPFGHYWSPNDGAIDCLLAVLLANMFLADVRTNHDNLIDVDIILSKLNSCSNNDDFDLSAFFAAHGVDVDGVPLTHEDVISHFLNGQCAGRDVPGCSEVACGVRSPIKIALTVTEAIVVHCECKQISLGDLRMYCSAIGIATMKRPEYTVLAQKLKTRCTTLRPLLNCDGLETILCGVETLGKQSLQHLTSQHNLSTNPAHDTDPMKAAVVDHITCQGLGYLLTKTAAALMISLT